MRLNFGCSKKGQITTFIIIGIMILFIVLIIFYLRKSNYDNVDVLDYTPEDLKPVEKYLVNCLENSAKSALIKMGMQGGYIELPAQYSNPRTYLQVSEGAIKTPLWRIEGVDIYPDIELMQTQLKKYVEKELPTCAKSLNELESVKEVWFQKNPVVTVSINTEDVSFILDYEFDVKSDNEITTYKKFGIRMPVRLYDILSSASLIIKKNTEDLFLAKNTVNILAMDPDIPLGDMKLDCSRMRWSKTEIKTKIQDYLTFLIPRIRVQGTKFKPFKEPLAVYERFDAEWNYLRFEQEGSPKNLPDDMYDYLHTFWAMDADFGSLNIGFSYTPQYGMNLNINPSDGDRLEANSGKSSSKYLKFLCLNIYHFTYDISYPVKVSLYDSTAFNGEGYLFSFGMPVEIEKNIPTSHPPSMFMMDAYETDANFCNNVRSEIALLTAKNYFTGEYLNNVDITYDCIKYYCNLGKISTENSYGLPALITSYPEGCYNGFIIAEKEGYLRVKKQFNDAQSTEIEMFPLKAFDFGFYQLINGMPNAYNPNYYALIYFKSKNTNFDGYYKYPFEVGQEKKLYLLAGPETYDLEIYLYLDDNLVGGYIGDWYVSSSDVEQNKIFFYGLEKIELARGASSEQLISLYDFLEKDTEYKNKYYPEFR